MRRQQPFWMLPVVLFAALSLLLAACGDDDESATGSDQSTEADGDSSGDATDSTGDQAADVGDQSENAAEDAAEDVIGTELGGDCAFLGEFASADLEGLDPSAFLQGGDLGEGFSNLSDQLDEVADAAPEEIRDSFQTLADGMREFTEAMEGIELDFSDPANVDQEALQQLQELQNNIGPEFEAAATEIDTWMQENCSAQG